MLDQSAHCHGEELRGTPVSVQQAVNLTNMYCVCSDTCICVGIPCTEREGRIEDKFWAIISNKSTNQMQKFLRFIT
jgi:hypothetical protein